MKKLIASLIAVLLIAAAASAAPQAILSGLKGKVEVKRDQGAWIPATNGMVVDLRTTISTGFDSTATIQIEKSKIVVKPLTRLTLDKLLEQSGSVSASLFLRVGAVQASVKAAVPGTPQDFKVQSPYSTASVRGTEFSFDGFYLKVVEGVVVLVPGRPVRDVQSGGSAGGGGGTEGTGGTGTEGTSGTGTEGTGGTGTEGTGGTGTEGTAGGGDTGFAGTTDVDPANLANGVAVAPGQQAALQVFYAMNTGTGASGGATPPSGTGGTGGGTGTPPPTETPRSGVVITVTGP